MRIKAILFGVIGTIGILFLMECYIQGSRMVPPSFTDYVEGLGRVRRANLDFVMFGEGFTINRFNEGRYLGPYYPPGKQQNTIRLAILGDSFVEGFQVFDRHHFRKILEDELTARLKLQVEVLNFGRSGFDIEDMVAYQYLMINQFDPDFVLYFLFKEDYSPTITDQLVPNLSFDHDSVVAEMKANKKYLDSFVRYKDLQNSFTYLNMISNCVKQYKHGLSGQKLLGKFYRPVNDRSKGLSSSEEISMNDDEINRIKTLLEFGNRDSSLIIVKSDQISIPSELQSIIAANCISFIDLSPPLQSLESSGVDPYYWNVTHQYGHWNHQAHIAIGNYLANETYEIIDNQE